MALYTKGQAKANVHNTESRLPFAFLCVAHPNQEGKHSPELKKILPPSGTIPEKENPERQYRPVALQSKALQSSEDRQAPRTATINPSSGGKQTITDGEQNTSIDKLQTSFHGFAMLS